MSEMSEETTVESPAGSIEPATARQNRRQVKVGTVVSNKMTQTVIVAVEILVNDRLYHRRMKKTTIARSAPAQKPMRQPQACIPSSPRIICKTTSKASALSCPPMIVT